MWPMLLSLCLVLSRKAPPRRAPRRRPGFRRPLVETLETRTVPSPVLTVSNVSVPGSAGAAVSNSGTWQDTTAGATATLTASYGSVTQNGDGTWTWSGTVPSAATGVVIYNNDDMGGRAAADFWLGVGQVFQVTNTFDDGSSTSSLPWAITQVANDATDTAAQPDLIAFNIPASGLQTIVMTSPTPTITNPVIIDGGTQPGWLPNTLPLTGTGAGENAVWSVALDGSILPASVPALTIAGGNSTIQGLDIHDINVGIDLTTSGNDVVSGNEIGRTYEDILVDGVSDNTIGGTTLAARNVITGTANIGIRMQGSSAAPASGNLIQGNYIGLNADGTVATGLGPIGVWLLGAVNNTTIGGSSAQAGNVISGWTEDVFLAQSHVGTGTDCVVQGNYIGTNPAGSAALGSMSSQGIVDEFTGTNIQGNLISGFISGWGTAVTLFGAGCTVQGNLIGTDATGTHRIPDGTGLRVAVDNAQITGNTIAFNDGPAISVTLGDGNHTGIQIDGNSIHDNAGAGVWVSSDPFGSADPFGAFSDGDSTGTSIQRNAIYGNTGLGIDLGTIPEDANGNQVSDPNLWALDAPSGAAIPNDTLGHVVLLNSKLYPAGANYFQDFPVLTSAVSTGTDTSVTGTFSSGTANGQPFESGKMITLDFYANPSPDPSGYGQGQTFLWETTVNTDANGNAPISVDIPTGNLAGQWITATATGPDGSTSEFSADLPILAPNETFAQFLQGALPQSSTTANSLTIVAGPGTPPATVLAAVNGLTNVTYPVTLVLELGNGTFSTGGVPADPPGAATLMIQNGTLTGGLQTNGNVRLIHVTLDPDHPALTVTGGQVSVLGCTLTTSGDAPTLLVTGGSVTLRNDDITQTSTSFAEPAITVTGGTVDLGTTPSPGGNTVNVNGGGTLVQNETSTPIPAVGDTFTVNGSTLAPSSLSGVVWQDFNDDGQVDFGENGIDGVTITLTGTDFLGNAVNQSQQTSGGGAYSFLNLLPGSYYLTETQPAGYVQGIDSVGTAGGSLSATDQFSVSLDAGVNGLNYNFGEQPPAGSGVHHGQTAGIGFWNNKNGQALIKALPVVTNADGSVTSVANWLAATLPNTFGSGAVNDLASKSNAYVAALFQSDFVLKGVKLDAQLLATALSVYATNATLDPTQVAASYGFTVSGDGAGTATANVGSNGDAFGVANNTTMTLLDLLLAADAQAVNGVLYGGNATRRNEANAVFSAVNQGGGIS
jgi:hypothetical protein